VTIEDQLILHEGLRLQPYRDSLGIWTVGVGYNLEARGPAFLEAAIGRRWRGMTDTLTREEALKVLRADVARVEALAQKHFSAAEWERLGEVRRRAVVDFVFNLERRALGFKKALLFLRMALDPNAGGYAPACLDACAFHMMDSAWARQVGDGLGGRVDRADRLAWMIRKGEDRP
jgi:lysozyme